VSASIAHLFSQHAASYQAVAGRAAAFHEQFIQHLNASARSYAGTEAANTASLRPLEASTGPHAGANAGVHDQARNESPSAGVRIDLANSLIWLATLLLPDRVPSAEAFLRLLLLFGVDVLVALLRDRLRIFA
jgi:PE family